MRSLRDMADPYPRASEVSIVSENRHEWRLVRSAIFGRLTFAITAAMGNFFEPVARLV
jgi:hypothetical protein